MTGRQIRFTDETEFRLPEPFAVNDVHLDDISFILNVETDGDRAATCTVDMEKLIQAMILFSSMENHRHGWRR